MDKKAKKIIVNGLTISRIIGTIMLPILFTTMSPLGFVGLIGVILSTDFLDGALARHWGVSTIFGSLLDMTADKLLALSLLITLSTMYPIMLIPLALEVIIASANIKSSGNGVNGKSTEIGRIKTVLMGMSMFTLFLTGLSPKIIEELKSINLNDLAYNLESFINSNKNTIETISKSAAIVPEGIVAADYTVKSLKSKNNDSKRINISELKKYKEYIKKVLLDEEYYKKTKDLNLVDKLMPDEKVKKLVLKNNTLDN